MKLKNSQIIADKREQKSGIPRLLKSVGLNVTMTTLPIGDYIIAQETVVERKSTRDLMASILDGRLLSQCSRLKEHFEHPIILIEGNVDEVDNIVENPLVFYGAISTIVLDFKIPVIPTSNACHTAKLLVSMCLRKDFPAGPYLKKIKKSLDLEGQQLSVLCSLPGIGEKFAVRMLAEFETLSNVFNATIPELKKVEGLGDARAKKLKDVLNFKVRRTPKIKIKG